MTTGNLIIISAASGTGKTSLVKRLLAEESTLEVSLSTTTRQPRPGEVDGVDYHFTDVATFKSLEADGEFLESARVFENFYGTRKSLVESQLEAGKNVILEIDWQGAQKARKAINKAISIFILPPSQQALDERLHNRAQDSEETIQKRLLGAKEEISHYDEFDIVIINDDFEQTLQQLKNIIQADYIDTKEEQQKIKTLAESLLQK